MAFRTLVLLCFFILIFSAGSVAKGSINSDGNKNNNKGEKPSKSIVKKTRSFSSLEVFENDINSTENTKNFFLEDALMPVTVDQESVREKIDATYRKIIDENRFVDFLDQGALIDLPVGLKADLGILTYIILIDSVVMTPSHSYLFASMRFETPQGKVLHFKGSDIKFSAKGGLSGDAKMMLVGDYSIPLHGDGAQFIVKGANDQTFVEFDCSGYKQLSLDASLVFSRDRIKPEDDNREIIEGKNVSIDFTTTVVDWNDILVGVNVPKFQVSGVDGISFSVTDAVLDFSDTRNATAVQFPDGYEQVSPLLIDGNYALWQGVYIRDLTITLPPQFESKDENGDKIEESGHEVSFKGKNLLIDNMGFTGLVSANNLIPIEKGKIGNWAFSLDRIYLDIYANEIKRSGFDGLINIPINKIEEGEINDDTKYFKYEALIKPNNEYLFNVSSTDNLNFELWKAEVNLHPSSYIDIQLVDGEFLPKAHLNGVMSMNVGLNDKGDADVSESKNVKISNITFEALEVQSKQPYVKVGNFSLGTEGGDSGMGGFPLSINKIYGKSSGDDIVLGLDVTIGLIKEADGGFAAGGGFEIHSEGYEQNVKLAYRYKELKINRFAVDIDKGVVKLKGELNFYKEDAVYGNGISGIVDATFGSVQVQASAIFGKKDDLRYWYADVLAGFKAGVPIFTGFALYSIGGGAYYHMEISDNSNASQLGQTASGFSYTLSRETGFGFKATVGIGTHPDNKSFNGDVTYEMAFNSTGGVKYINFRGNGYFMTNPVPVETDKLQDNAKKLASVSKQSGGGDLNDNEAVAENVYGSPSQSGERAQLYAKVLINYDFASSTLHGNFQAYVNAANGLIKGGGINNLAGEVVMHFSPTDWYVHVGKPEPSKRISLEFANLARLDAYLVAGTKIPGSPALPANVSSILGDIDLDYMGDLNALGDGAGIGFGASFNMSTGNKEFLIFYGSFDAGLGFDIMLKNYENVQCVGGGALGINGWYANGQAYSYLEGEVGVKVEIFKTEKNIKIMDLGAAVVLQAKLPNPVWLKGMVGGYYNVLNGLVKGNFSLEMEIGEECEMIQGQQNSVLEGIEVLADATPLQSSNDVDVFTVPQAVFNYEIEKVYEMINEGNGEVVQFKIGLDKFELMQDGTPISADLQWNEGNTVAALNPFSILPPQKELTMNVDISFKEKKGGLWMVSQADGESLVENHVINFITGEAPDYIPDNNIAYSYPSRNQFNYYKNEYSKGYITLKQDQEYLFKANSDWDQVIRFTAKSGESVDAPFTYIKSMKELAMNMPTDFTNDQIYKLSVVNVPKSSLTTIDENVTASTEVLSNADVKTEITTRAAQGVLREVEEKEIYSTNFRVSKYNTFEDKVISASPSQGFRDPIIAGVHRIGSNIRGSEPFSLEEILGIDGKKPLVQSIADVSNNPWYEDYIFPLVYEGYPLKGTMTINNRDVEELGTIPLKGVILYQIPYQHELSQDEISSGSVDLTFYGGALLYYLPFYMYYDWSELAGKAANYVTTNGFDERLNKLISTPFPVIRRGDYWINMNYTLPGKGTITSTYRHKIVNPMD